MTIFAEQTIYIGSDLKLYGTESATQCLPSHEIVVNHGVDCKFTFIIKSDFDDTFKQQDPIVWSPSRPSHITAATLESNDKTLTFHDQNIVAQAGGGTTSFKLYLVNSGEVGTCFFSGGGVAVDPTIVDKGDEGYG